MLRATSPSEEAGGHGGAPLEAVLTLGPKGGPGRGSSHPKPILSRSVLSFSANEPQCLLPPPHPTPNQIRCYDFNVGGGLPSGEGVRGRLAQGPGPTTGLAGGSWRG